MLQQQEFEIGWQFSQEAQVVRVYNQVLVGLRWSKHINSITSSNEMKGIVKTLFSAWYHLHWLNCKSTLQCVLPQLQLHRCVRLENDFFSLGVERAAPWIVCGVSGQ